MIGQIGSRTTRCRVGVQAPGAACNPFLRKTADISGFLAQNSAPSGTAKPELMQGRSYNLMRRSLSAEQLEDFQRSRRVYGTSSRTDPVTLLSRKIWPSDHHADHPLVQVGSMVTSGARSSFLDQRCTVLAELWKNRCRIGILIRSSAEVVGMDVEDLCGDAAFAEQPEVFEALEGSYSAVKTPIRIPAEDRVGSSGYSGYSTIG